MVMADEASRLDIQTNSSTPGEAHVQLVGELDPHTAPEFESAMLELLDDSELVTVQIDLDGLRFIDSSGLRVILRVQRSLEERAGRLLLLSPSRTVARLLDITGLTGYLEVE
jgi:anti-anti-sigma factor